VLEQVKLLKPLKSLFDLVNKKGVLCELNISTGESYQSVFIKIFHDSDY
jgi:hypothetical protein